ncbi:heterokaryon incompatibility protein-domain-containing protein [Hyaloscypha sp. PMI_1271]|nr:heterokaryon incompatibility protein-domain-containing protein [Hyaloscypha sp. PMI_1271]
MNRSAGAEVASYVYTPLSQPRAIRVATILPGERTDPVHVALQEHNLDDENLQYEAVSYCWGSVHRTSQVICDNQAIMVTENLIAALLRFRNPTEERILWIDSICINQNAIDERNHQVKLMGNVYQNASRVLVWLGEEDETTELAYSCMQAYFELKEPNVWREFESASRKIRGSAAWDKNNRTLSMLKSNPAEIAAVQALLDRPWFSRAWTFQEGRLSRETLVVTGSYEIHGSSISKIQDGIVALNIEVGFCLFGDAFLKSVIRLYFLFNPKFTISDIPEPDFWEGMSFLLTIRRGAEARDPRDVVYSLIGIASLTSALEIEPDYGTSWERLYTSDPIVPANLGPGLETAIPFLPSQTPDHCGLPREYYASGSSRVAISHNDDPARLQLRGLRCDEVGRISVSKVDINAVPTRDHLWSANISNDELTNFMTSGGLLGIGPRHLKVGDHIFVFLGGEVPHLLRKTEAETEYAFVGECHVHGLMKGEALLKARKMADPNYDLGDTEWLDQLHEGEIPFPTEEVAIR